MAGILRYLLLEAVLRLSLLECTSAEPPSELAQCAPSRCWAVSSLVDGPSPSFRVQLFFIAEKFWHCSRDLWFGKSNPVAA